ncbi:MAG TPA: methyltransferase domain-containing protein [Gemmatimonadaceae bacterium]
MMNDTTRAPKSLVLHSMARYYDLLGALLTFGRERELRERLAQLASLAEGESVLDVGCGTGSLAIAAKRRVGTRGTVSAVDASSEMIALARRKAAKARLDVGFHIARAEALPFPDSSFDVVLSTLMMHHLPRAVRECFVAEIRRVLRPGGRVLVVDFEKPADKRGGLISRFHRHGHVPLRDIIRLLSGAGLPASEMGSVGVSDLQFALAMKPRDSIAPPDIASPSERSMPPLGAPRWLLPIVIIAVVAAHFIALRGARAALALGALASLTVVAFVLVHVAFAGGFSGLIRRHRRR